MLGKYGIDCLDSICFFLRSFLANLGERIQQNESIRRPHMISEPITDKTQSTLYTNCSYEELTGEKLISSVSILPQIDPLPNMFTYVPLQRNFLVRSIESFEFIMIGLCL